MRQIAWKLRYQMCIDISLEPEKMRPGNIPTDSATLYPENNDSIFVQQSLTNLLRFLAFASVMDAGSFLLLSQRTLAEYLSSPK